MEDQAKLQPAVRITLRPLGNPLPLGLYSFGIGMLLLAAQTAGWVPLHEDRQVGIILASFVFPLEGLAAVMAFLARDTLASTLLGLFATSWLSNGLGLITGAPGATSLALAFFLLAFAAPVAVLALVAVTGKPLVAGVLALSATRSILDGIYQAGGPPGLEHASAYVALAIAAAALYAGTAFVLEDMRQETLLPVLRRGAGRAAMEGELPDQLPRVESEAGVRPQL